MNTHHKSLQYLLPLTVMCLVAIVGGAFLLGSHAATPYGSATASTGNLTTGANSQSCTGASQGNCVTFGQAIPLDGDVALALSKPGAPFAPTSFWNTPLPASIPLNPNNNDYVNEIANQLCSATFATTAPNLSTCTKSNTASLNITSWSAPLYVVPNNQPLVSVSRCGNGITDQNMSDSNWTSTGWTATSTSATHTTGNANPLSTSQFEPVPTTKYQVTYTFSGSPANGSTMAVTMGGITVGSYTFSNATGGQDNFTDTKVITTAIGAAGNAVLQFTPSSTFNGTVSAVSVVPYNATFNSVVAGGIPIPADAHGSGETITPDVDTDQEIQIYQPSTDKEWEFWKLQKDGSGNWTACSAGVINNASQSNGIFPSGTGATATGLPLIGGIPRVDEFQTGQIDHVMGLSLMDNFYATPVTPPTTPPTLTFPANVTDPGGKAYSWPANRNDGGSADTLAIPEGQRFRLNPDLDLSTLNLTPYAMAIAVAAQKYGFVVDDSAGTVNIRVTDPTTYTVAGLSSPYTNGVGVGGVNNGNKGLFDGVTQSQIMKNFPWDELEALPFNYGEPGS